MLLDLYKPHVSGVTNHVALTKATLMEMGHEVYVFTFGEEDFVDDEPNVLRSPGLPLTIPAADLDVQISLRYSREAQHLLRSMDVVHVHHPSISGRLALRYCRPRRIPIVYTNHTRYDLYYQAYLPWMPDVFGEAFFRTFLPLFCRAMDLVVAPSNGLKSVLEDLGVEVPIAVVPNGVDLKPALGKVKAIERAALNLTAEQLVLLYVGRLGPEKNLPFLLRAFGGAAQAYDDLRLVVVGDGPERDNLEDRVKVMGLAGKVIFTGMVPYTDIPRYLKMADVFVTASVTEVHPLTVIEAMAAGLPVLGIHSPGISDTVRDVETGFLSKEELPEFTAKLIRIATNETERKHMSLRAVEVAKTFAIEKTSVLLLEQYEHAIQLVKQKPQPLHSRLLHLLDNL